MSLFQRPIQPPAILSDRAVERYLEAVRAELSVDPLFRRRLRGTVVNRFVADREGSTSTRRRRRTMGGLGRAVLYATFALSVSVSSAMAASQGAAPGDALYPLKLQIERLRLQALPDHLHDDLAAHALGERIHELGVLAERGDWTRVTAQAAAIEEEYRHFVDTAQLDDSTDQYVLVLTELLQRLPDRAQLAIEDVLEGVQGASDGASSGDGNGSGAINGGGGSAAAPGNGPQASAEPTPRPSRPDRPDPTPRATKSPRPSPEPAEPAETDAAGD